MRLVVFAMLLAVAGCPSYARNALDNGEDATGQGAPGECSIAADCVPAGSKCCDCPTHAVPINDPFARACSDVDCPTQSCGSPMQAECNGGKCVLECSPVACPELGCAEGFQTDGNGCLVCECAALSPIECSFDTDCARVRADCCGCSLGGEDTAVPTTQVNAHEAQLGCPANPSCPGGDTCAPDLAARCVQGMCTLVSGTLPPNACGRADLAPCPAGEVCVVNANETATMQGVGVCLQP